MFFLHVEKYRAGRSEPQAPTQTALGGQLEPGERWPGETDFPSLVLGRPGAWVSWKRGSVQLGHLTFGLYCPPRKGTSAIYFFSAFVKGSSYVGSRRTLLVLSCPPVSSD